MIMFSTNSAYSLHSNFGTKWIQGVAKSTWVLTGLSDARLSGARAFTVFVDKFLRWKINGKVFNYLKLHATRGKMLVY